MFYNSLTPQRNFLQSWPHLSYQVPGNTQEGIQQAPLPANPAGNTPIPLGAPGYGGYAGPQGGPASYGMGKTGYAEGITMAPGSTGWQTGGPSSLPPVGQGHTTNLTLASGVQQYNSPIAPQYGAGRSPRQPYLTR